MQKFFINVWQVLMLWAALFVVGAVGASLWLTTLAGWDWVDSWWPL